MAAFAFYALSEEEQSALRQNPRRCVALLRPCKPLADQLAHEGGISAPLSMDDEQLLQGFHLIAQSFQSYQYESVFHQLCQQAGLLPSDVGLLSGRVETLYRQREPALYEAKIISALKQWSRNQEKEGEE